MTAVLAISAAVYLFLPRACQDKTELVEISRPLMGTLFTVKVYSDSPDQAREAIEKSFAAANRLQKILSAHDAESELSSLNDAPYGVPFHVSGELSRALALSLDYAEKSGGAFDPTLGPCIRLWKKSRSRLELPSREELDKARAASGYGKLVLSSQTAVKSVPGMRLDLGGIGKGIAADGMAVRLVQEGFPVFCISTTSDVLAGDPPPGRDGWHVAFDTGEHRREKQSVILSRAALSTSGDRHQSFTIGGTLYSHIINPKTGLGLTSPDNNSAVTIMSPTAAEADALATACRVLSPLESKKLLTRFPGSKKIH